MNPLSGTGTSRIRLGIVSIAALAIVLSGCSGTVPSTASGPSAMPPSPAPPSATAVPSPLGPSPSVSPIAYGVYTGQPILMSTIDKVIKADKALSATERAQMLKDTVGQTATTFRLTFEQGAGGDRFIQEQSVDGGAWFRGDTATYAFSNDHTLVTQNTDGTSTWAVAFVSGGFSLKAIWPANSPASAQDRLTVHFIYESSQFTRQP
jgi:hypothetical protein